MQQQQHYFLIFYTRKETLEMLKIPPGSTEQLQLLHKEFFYQWKELCGCVSVKLICERTSKFDFFWNDVLKMRSFIHYQFHLLNLKMWSDTRSSLYCEIQWNNSWVSKAYNEGFSIVTVTTETVSFLMLQIWKTIAWNEGIFPHLFIITRN
jgi:hypothetical protein